MATVKPSTLIVDVHNVLQKRKTDAEDLRKSQIAQYAEICLRSSTAPKPQDAADMVAILEALGRSTGELSNDLNAAHRIALAVQVGREAVVRLESLRPASKEAETAFATNRRRGANLTTSGTALRHAEAMLAESENELDAARGVIVEVARHAPRLFPDARNNPATGGSWKSLLK